MRDYKYPSVENYSFMFQMNIDWLISIFDLSTLPCFLLILEGYISTLTSSLVIFETDYCPLH